MHIIESADLPRAPFTEFEGQHYGTSISLIMVTTDEPGAGPDLHQHPYPETFVIRSGSARFTVGDEQIIGVGGQIIVVPPNTPHTFAVIGPAPLDMIDVHANEVFITEWLSVRRSADAT